MTLSFGKLEPVPDTFAEDLPEEWVTAWRDAVLSCMTPVGLLDLQTERLLGLSPPIAALLGVAPDHEAPVLFECVAERPEQARAFIALAREGYFDGLEGKRKFHRPDGSNVEMASLGRVIAFGEARDMSIWAMGETASVVSAGSRARDHATVRPLDVEAAGLTIGIVDDRWRVLDTDAPAESSDWAPRRGATLSDLTHPSDMSALLLAMAAATTAAGAKAHLRWHVGGEWRTSVVSVTMRGGETGPHFAIAVYRPLAGAPIPLDESALSALGDLPARQREVLMRLVRGERVRQIARDMYLSESTVRNHLVAIYRKAGVHSQDELLGRLRVADEVAAHEEAGQLTK